MPDRDLLPLDDLARPDAILSLLGSFWGRTYGARGQVRAYGAALGEAAAQAQHGLREAALALGRSEVPPWHAERWTILYLRQGQRLAGLARYGDGAAFGDGTVFGAPRDGADPAWPCALAGCPALFNRITAPSRTLVAGVDFAIDRGVIRFRDDPFADPRLARRDVIVDGQSVDREVALWAFQALTDREAIYRHFGYALGVRAPSGIPYRDLVNAAWDALVGGTATVQLLDALAAMAGAPRARESGEVVRLMSPDAHGLAIVTDRRAYRFGAGATPVVTPGRIVAAGDALVDTVEVHELNAGVVPAGITTLAIGPGLLAPGYYGDLGFSAAPVPLEVAAGPGRFTKVRFALGGFPADVDRFWDEVHARGVARGQTLAHLLDIRDDPQDEPTAASLPATISPLEFLVENLLRGQTLLVRIRTGGLGPDALGLGSLRLLRRIVPPHVALLVLIDLPPLHDSATMGPTSEGLDTFDGGAPLDEATGAGAIQDGSAVRNVTEACA